MTTPAKQTGQQFAPLGDVNAPADWDIPKNLVLSPQIVYASFNGSAATGSYIPTLEVVSDSGHVIGEFPQDVTVAAGASCDATWSPFLSTTPASSGLATTETSISLLGETFSTNGGSLGNNGTSGGALYTTVFPFVFPAGTTITGVTQYQSGATAGTGTGNVSFGLCDATGKILTTTGLLGTLKFTVAPTYLKFPFTAPLTLSTASPLIAWQHWWNGTWSVFSMLGANSQATMQNPPQDWHTVLGGFPPRSTNLSFGTSPPAVGATISLLGNPTDPGGHVLYLGLY